MKRVYNRLLLLLDYLRVMWRYFQHHDKHVPCRPAVAADFNTMGHVSYYYGLLRIFEAQGYSIHLRHRYKYISLFMDAFRGAHFLTLKRFKISFRPPRKPNDFIFIYDKHSDWVHLNWKQKIHVHPDFFPYVFNGKTPKPEQLTISFQEHPKTLNATKNKDLKGYRTQKRTALLCFSGNMTPSLYQTSDIENVYKKLNRIRMVELTKAAFPDEETILVRHQPDYELLKTNQTGKFVIVDYEQPYVRNNRPPDRLGFLSSSNFFLSCPGINTPICHNAIEALSVGTILLTEYPEYFYPPLVHLESCVAFKGEEGLKNSLELIKNMRQEDLERLRKNSMVYYDHHLSLAFLYQKITDDKVTEIIYQAEGTSLRHYLKNHTSLPNT